MSKRIYPEPLRLAFIAGFHLTELWCFLSHSLQAPLSGLPSPLYLDFRRRARVALEILRENSVDKNTLGTLERAINILPSRRQFGGPIQDNSRLRRVMVDSVAMARDFDLAMANARKQLPRSELICYSSGWVFAGVGFASRMIRKAPRILAGGGGSSSLTRRTYVAAMEYSSNAANGFLANLTDEQSLPSSVTETAHLSVIQEIVDVISENPAIPDDIALLLEQCADRVLEDIRSNTIYTHVLEELDNMYFRKRYPQVSLEAAEQMSNIQQLLDDATLERTRHLESKDIARLDAAIAHANAALEFCDPPSMGASICLDMLAGLHWERFLHTGSRSDLDQAISIVWRALREAPWQASTAGSMLNNLGLVQTTVFEQERQRGDIDLAIDAFREAIGSEDHPTEQSLLWWNNYANALRQRYHNDRDIRDLEETIRCAEVVLAATQADSEDYAIHRQNLANALIDRFTTMKPGNNVKDLGRAINLLQEAINHPNTSPIDRSICLSTLANAFKVRCVFSGGESQSATDAYRESLKFLDARLPLALETAVSWGDWAFGQRKWAEAIEAYGHASRISDALFKIQISRAHQESFLKSTQGVAIRAAYSLAQASRLEDAVVTLEAGLARMLGDALEKSRRDLRLLSELGYLDLYDRYIRQANALAQAAGLISELRQGNRNVSEPPPSVDHLSAALENTVAKIRGIPGYERFLQGLSFDEIRRVSAVPLVYLLPTAHGGLALVVTAVNKHVSAIPLPEMTAQWVSNQAAHHLATVQAQTSVKSDADHRVWLTSFDNVLSGLWTVVMEPIAELLNGFKRLTLVPTYLLQVLPLHAACASEYPFAERRYLIDRISVAYAPSARALINADLGNASRENCSAIVVQVSDSKWHGFLPDTALETELIKQCFSNCTHLRDSEATPAAILSLIVNADVLHFSCHGFANLQHPLESGLVVAGDNTLTLRDFLSVRVRTPFLVTLSACETGLAGVGLPDEFIGLPAGLLQLGAAAVISTLWTVDDRAAALISGRFYYLWRRKKLPPLKAFLEAQRWIRESTSEQFVMFLEELGPWSSKDRAEQIIRFFRGCAQGERLYSHASYWAPFFWTGSSFENA